MTSKDCGHYDDDDSPKSPLRRLLVFLLSLIILILFLILLIYLILRPQKPRFVLQDATVFAFNTTQPNLLTTTFQVTLSTRNPNDRIGVYYESLYAFVSYHNQQITLLTSIPPTYQGHHDVVVWSPFLSGNSVPVAPFLAASLAQDQNAGLTLVNVKLSGRVKWKVGTWISGRYHIWVNCPAYITFGSRNNGVPVGSGFKYQVATSCQVDV